MNILEITEFFNSVFKDIHTDDFSNNGLQVQASHHVAKAAFAVDACMDTFEKAAQEAADVLFVHHGISWGGGIKAINGFMASRIAKLFDAKLSLYAMHLPLDMHPEVGNNAVIANMLGLRDRTPFCRHGDNAIGIAGTLPAPMTPDALAHALGNALQARTCIPLACKKAISTVGIVSGAGDSALDEAAQRGFDCLVSGTFRHEKYHQAREQAVTIIAAGHYATETTGVRAMVELTRKATGLECVFIDSPTDL